MSLGIFIYGLLVSGIVAGACWLIAAGIRDERRDRERLESEQGSALAAGRRHRTETREDGRTVETGGG